MVFTLHRAKLGEAGVPKILRPLNAYLDNYTALFGELDSIANHIEGSLHKPFVITHGKLWEVCVQAQ